MNKTEKWKAQHANEGERGWEVASHGGREQVCNGLTETNAKRIQLFPDLLRVLKDAKQAFQYFAAMNPDRLKPPALWHIEKINEVLKKIEGGYEQTTHSTPIRDR